jgi:nucleoside-diphosphate-sugar epimerase
MQTIIGANGSIGTLLAKELKNHTDKIRLVSRNPLKINPDDELIAADAATESRKISDAVKDSDVVYLTIGLPYLTKVWKKQWHPIMANVIEACKTHNSKLVFFDNVYMYGKVDGKMTEETPINPCSQKGEIRAEISEKLTSEMKKGNVKALIARSADFLIPKR